MTVVPTPAETAPPAFEEPDIEMEEGELEDETGHEQQTTLAQDKIQVLTKDVSVHSTPLSISSLLCFSASSTDEQNLS